MSQLGPLANPQSPIFYRVQVLPLPQLIFKYCQVLLRRGSISLAAEGCTFYCQILVDMYAHEQCMIVHCTKAILMGHCPFGRLIEKLGILMNDVCRSCGSEKLKNTVFQLMCQCLDLAIMRRTFVTSHSLTSLTMPSNMKITAITKFILYPE